MYAFPRRKSAKKNRNFCAPIFIFFRQSENRGIKQQQFTPKKIPRESKRRIRSRTNSREKITHKSSSYNSHRKIPHELKYRISSRMNSHKTIEHKSDNYNLCRKNSARIETPNSRPNEFTQKKPYESSSYNLRVEKIPHESKRRISARINSRKKNHATQTSCTSSCSLKSSIKSCAHGTRSCDEACTVYAPCFVSI